MAFVVLKNGLSAGCGYALGKILKTVLLVIDITMKPKFQRHLIGYVAIGGIVVMALAFTFLPDIIRQLNPYNVRHDESNENGFFSRIVVDNLNPNSELSVYSEELQGQLLIVSYPVVSMVDIDLLIAEFNINFEDNDYIIYGINYNPLYYQGLNLCDKYCPSYQFLYWIENETSMRTWYLTRPVTPIFEYNNCNGQLIRIINEGVTVAAILETINILQGIMIY